MVPTQRQRGACLGLAIWLNLSVFWSWATSPLTWKTDVLWLSSPTPLLSEERRGLRQIRRNIWWHLKSERFKKRFEAFAILVVVLLTLVSLYTAESVSCSIGNSCLFASAHWANWLFGK